MVQPASFIKTMTTKTKPTTVLEKRIQRFYDLLNRKAFEQCVGMIDPLVRDNPTSVTLLQYVTALRNFLEAVSKVQVQQIDMELHLDEPSKLYGDRDFAVGQSLWLDQAGLQHTFQER